MVIINNRINKKLSFAIVAIFFVAVFFLINHSPKNLKPEDIKYVSIGGQKIKVDVVTTGAEQEQGLSGRVSLATDQGMLFVFPIDGKYAFWMKDMNFPIDMIWIGSDGRVTYIKKDARPELYPEIYTPTIDSKYVLEVISGFADKNNLKEGDSVTFY